MKSVLFIIIFLTVACSKDEFPQYTKLDRLKILALVADTPEIQNPSAGVTTVNLDPYISDVNGTGAVTLTVQSCLDPGVQLGAAPTCANAQYASATQNISVSDPAGQAAGVFGSPERTGKPSTGAISVGLQIPPGFLSAFSAPLKYNGVAYLIVVTATRGNEVVRSFKRILVSNKAVNLNPGLADLFADGTSLTVLPPGEVSLSFTASSSLENYQFMSMDGSLTSVTERFETTWFVTDGEIENPRTQSGQTTLWKVAPPSPGRQAVLAGVLRDGRGGVSVLIKKF